MSHVEEFFEWGTREVRSLPRRSRAPARRGGRAHVRWLARDEPDELVNDLALCALHARLLDRGVWPDRPGARFGRRLGNGSARLADDRPRPPVRWVEAVGALRAGQDHEHHQSEGPARDEGDQDPPAG